MSDGEEDFLADSPAKGGERKRLKKKNQKAEEDDISLPSSSDEENDKGSDDANQEDSDAEVVEAEVQEEQGEESSSADGEGNGEDEGQAEEPKKGKKRTRSDEKERPKKKRKTFTRAVKAKRKQKESESEDAGSGAEDGKQDMQMVIDLTHRAGLPPFEMSHLEAQYFLTYADGFQMRYLDIRNFLVSTWKRNPKELLSLARAKEMVLEEYLEELEPIYDFLTRHGYINSGIFEGWEKKKAPFIGKPPRIVIVGSGAAGLGCAQQLLHWGYDVTVLEARDRIGGRCNTTRDLDSEVDLGASIITGLIRNPLDNLFTQLELRSYTIGSESIMRTSTTGESVDLSLDAKMNTLFNSLLDHVAATKDPTIGDRALGKEMEKILPKLPPLDTAVLNWYYANLEYACAADLSELSVLHWDQDDHFDFSGDHMILVDGYTSVMKPLSQNINVLTNHEVKRIEYGSSMRDMAVECSNGQKFECDAALITIPLGVLKKDTITFQPPLPTWKRESISSLGFGLLNKVAVLFDHVFWEKDKDWFGKVSMDNSRDNRGLYYLWWNYYKVVGEPILVAIVAGKASHALEERKDENIIDEVKRLMKTMFSLKELPTVVKYKITRWKKDIYAGGSYSYIAMGATGEDYDKLARPVEDVNGKTRLFFGGEHTCRQYPATVAGAYASGLREAERIHRHFFPPTPPTFRPRQTEREMTREKNRRALVSQQRKRKSRTSAPYRRGIRSHGNVEPKRKLNVSESKQRIEEDYLEEGDEEKASVPSTFQYVPIFSHTTSKTDIKTESQTSSSSSSSSTHTTASTTSSQGGTQTSHLRSFGAFVRKARKPELASSEENRRRPPPNPQPLLDEKRDRSDSKTLSTSQQGQPYLSQHQYQGQQQQHIQPQAQPLHHQPQPQHLPPPQQMHQHMQMPLYPLSFGMPQLQFPLANMNNLQPSKAQDTNNNSNAAAQQQQAKPPTATDLKSLFQNIQKEDSKKKEEDRRRRAREKAKAKAKINAEKERKRRKARKAKEPRDEKSQQFMNEAAKIIVNRLSRHLKEARVAKADFKDICRKLTHKVVDHERKKAGTFLIDDNKKKKMKKLVDDYVRAKNKGKNASKSEKTSVKKEATKEAKRPGTAPAQTTLPKPTVVPTSTATSASNSSTNPTKSSNGNNMDVDDIIPSPLREFIQY